MSLRTQCSCYLFLNVFVMRMRGVSPYIRSISFLFSLLTKQIIMYNLSILFARIQDFLSLSVLSVSKITSSKSKVQFTKSTNQLSSENIDDIGLGLSGLFFRNSGLTKFPEDNAIVSIRKKKHKIIIKVMIAYSRSHQVTQIA